MKMGWKWHIQRKGGRGNFDAVQVGTQKQVIICAEEPLPQPKLSAAVYSLKPLPLTASLQLLRQLHPKATRQFTTFNPFCMRTIALAV